MPKDIEADYHQTFMLPPCLEDWIPTGHPARFIRDLVEGMDLKSLGFQGRKEPVGAPRYSNDLLVKIWLYGYFEGLDSTRKLEKACLDRIGFIWLTGQNYPDHNTLWRFWHKNQQALRRLFIQSVKVGVKMNLAGMVLHAVDGTRIQSAASSAKGLSRKRLEQALSRVEGSIEKYMRAIQSCAPTQGDESGSQLPAQLQDAHRRKQEIQSALRELEEREVDQFHPADPDSAMVKCERGLRFGYNAQTVVDDKDGLVVAADVFSQSSDKGLLTEMLRETRENVSATAEQTVADGGYNTDSELGKAAAMGNEVLVCEHGQETKGEFSSSNFQYDSQADCYVCPKGSVLTFCGEDKSRKDPRRRYRCRDYKNCPWRMQCSKAKRGKMIVRSCFAGAVEEHRLRRDLPENRAKLKKRKAIVEHVFGWVKRTMHCRQWNACGLGNVRTQWAMLCTSWNLKIIYKYWAKLGPDEGLKGKKRKKDKRQRSVKSIFHYGICKTGQLHPFPA